VTQYWDIDERHAFEGDHVLLRQGYSTVIDYLVAQLRQRGDRFELVQNAPVTRVEYARKTASIPYFNARTNASMLELSDTCKVTTGSTERPEVCGDFVICALPLGVLKEAHSKASSAKLAFDPVLPFPKQDAIRSVGFGLLNKVFLQFSTAFWRLPGIVDDDTAQFGNASSCNPHHYMFFDMGKIMAKTESSSMEPPAILMTLISGCEAVMCEQMDDHELLGEVLATLHTLFEGTDVPEPSAYKITKWGSDEYCRGSYTYLPPGCTDQDFHVLQAPVNGNGDSILLETSETYRVFFAGEHTTALHPSMAHGALLSGYRAAKEVVSNMTHSSHSGSDVDKSIPLPIFRHQFPNAPLVCSLCGVTGSTIREGTLLAFKRGSRAVLVHHNCALHCPEVEVVEGLWKYVFQSCSRGREISCVLCGKRGATIGCGADVKCMRSYHFSCAEDTGYRFEVDSEGKEFVCDFHRRGHDRESRRISLEYYISTNHDRRPLVCSLCGISASRETGDLLAFVQGHRRVLIHQHCATYTNVHVNLAEDSNSRLTQDYRNIFAALDVARTCTRCSRPGATIPCQDDSCSHYYHFLCASGLDWKFSRRPRFSCPQHRHHKRSAAVLPPTPDASPDKKDGELFQHALFAQFADGGGQDDSLPVNQGMSQLQDDEKYNVSKEPDVDGEDWSDGDDSDMSEGESGKQWKVQSLSVLPDWQLGESRFVRIHRPSQRHHWKLYLSYSANRPPPNSHYLSFAKRYASEDDFDVIEKDEILVAINGTKIGMPSLRTMEDVLGLLKQEVELLVEVQRGFPEVDIF
jgi:hypothetical protein